MTTHSVPALTGLIPIATIPFDEAQRLDLDSLARELEHLKGANVDGIMVPGFASEFYKLDDSEARAVSSIVVDACREDESVTSIVSVAAHSTRVALDRTRWAIDYGANAINLLLPHYMSPSPNSLKEHMRAVLREAAPAPVVVQYAPQLTGATVSLDDIVAMQDEYENLRAIKVESTPPGPDVERILTKQPSLKVLVGYAGMHMIDAMERGAVGVQPSASFVEVYRSILDHWNRGDRESALELHRKLLPYVSYWMQNVELIIAIDKRIAYLRGWFTTEGIRTPARDLDRHELGMVDRFLEEFAEHLGAPSDREFAKVRQVSIPEAPPSATGE